MSECIESRIIKARKEHVCDYCSQAIVKGAKYEDFVGKGDEGVFHFKSHMICRFVAQELSHKYMITADGGLTKDQFEDAVNAFFEEFIYSKDVGLVTFPEKIVMVANILREYEFVCELKKPSKPYSRFWNPIKRFLRKRESIITIEE